MSWQASRSTLLRFERAGNADIGTWCAIRRLVIATACDASQVAGNPHTRTAQDFWPLLGTPTQMQDFFAGGSSSRFHPNESFQYAEIATAWRQEELVGAAAMSESKPRWGVGIPGRASARLRFIAVHPHHRRQRIATGMVGNLLLRLHGTTELVFSTWGSEEPRAAHPQADGHALSPLSESEALAVRLGMEPATTRGGRRVESLVNAFQSPPAVTQREWGPVPAGVVISAAYSALAAGNGMRIQDL